MGKILYFDCFSGISGDMTAAALLDLGLDQKIFLSELEKLGLGNEYHLDISRGSTYGIEGTSFDVHVHTGDQHHPNEKALPDAHPEPANHGRHLKEVGDMIMNSTLSHKTKAFAMRVFEEIARAEGAVHGIDPSRVHFHEVGAVDSIVDVVSAAIGLEMLDVDMIFSSSLREGSGTVETSHGTLPVPVPAVAKMLEGSKIPVSAGHADTELITPTGLAILKSAVSAFGPLPESEILATGYGIGKRDTGNPNALRVLLAETPGEKSFPEYAVVLETNLDDCSPEILGHVMEKLFGAGALDVWLTPVHMKKNRPGTLLSVLCREDRSKPLSVMILSETTSLGVRMNRVSRMTLDRKTMYVPTRYGDIEIKTAFGHGITKVAPEYESCRKAAAEHTVPVREAYEEAMSVFKQRRK